MTQHSSRAPDGLWTFASITPFAPFRLTANDAGWFTFKPDSCSTTHTYKLNIAAMPYDITITNFKSAAQGSQPHDQHQNKITCATVNLTLRSLTRLKRRAAQWKGRKDVCANSQTGTKKERVNLRDRVLVPILLRVTAEADNCPPREWSVWDLCSLKSSLFTTSDKTNSYHKINLQTFVAV